MGHFMEICPSFCRFDRACFLEREGRSPSIVAAYLMYSQKVDVDTALLRIQAKRPIVGYILPSAYLICEEIYLTSLYYFIRQPE